MMSIAYIHTPVAHVLNLNTSFAKLMSAAGAVAAKVYIEENLPDVSAALATVFSETLAALGNTCGIEGSMTLDGVRVTKKGYAVTLTIFKKQRVWDAFAALTLDDDLRITETFFDFPAGTSEANIIDWIEELPA